MKTQNTTEQKNSLTQGFVTDGKLVTSRDGRYLTIYFQDGSRLREHKNRFLAALNVPFDKEPVKEMSGEPETLTTGFIAKTRMFLSKNKKHLTIVFPGGRFTKHVNYFKAALGLDYVPETRNGSSESAEDARIA